MKKNSFFTLLLFSSVLMSCRPMIYAVFLQGRTVVDKATLMVNHTEGREVILIPMMHTGRPAYYQKVKNYLDTLRHRGYIVYYEGIGTVDPRMLPDSLRPKYDTIQRKFRRVTGMHLTGYDRKDNPSLPFKTKGKQVTETPELKGITKEDIHADLFIAELIKRYEAVKGEIVLTEYDFQTGLLEKYKLSRQEKEQYNSFFMLQELRNEYVSELFRTYRHPKVAIVYGAGHFWFLYAKIRDMGFEEVKKKK